VSYKHCLSARKDRTGIGLDQATGIQNVFVKDWKLNYFKDQKKKIACIPFTRNMIEYRAGDADPGFGVLTSLLHWKSDTATICEEDLDGIYCREFGGTAPTNGRKPVVDLIFEQAEQCLRAPLAANLEHKIVLSIAIRLKAERFMVDKIAEATFVEGIKSNQTSELMARFIQKFPEETGNIRVLKNVVLMTPENIHLNSFMYEPILDMSDEHLRKLYSEVTALT
jgi:hypothetical protein